MSTERDAPVRRPGRPRLDEGGGEVRERLLDAAMELAVEQGFDASGLREIAARADVSAGMIAYYFGDRTGLHEAMFRRVLNRVTEQVRSLVAQERSGGETSRLEDLVRIHVSALAADPWLAKLIARDLLAPADSALRNRLADRFEGGPIELIERWIAEEQAQGVVRRDLDPRLLAISIASLSAFPYLMLPLVGEHLGLELDEAFAARLIDHNQKILTDGIRARSEDGE
ncbi:MAG: TetR/AcrR family transcriptional regulator [Deltaproteobacteria bacterium]|nr:TetR/AcrR family transcriptional regulator [Deltaproteobacteria bacterium]MBW2499031.1 TetR/AcrR family transcriptional regulator [Deltaproteobacteria bacterium]